AERGPEAATALPRARWPRRGGILLTHYDRMSKRPPALRLALTAAALLAAAPAAAQEPAPPPARAAAAPPRLARAAPAAAIRVDGVLDEAAWAAAAPAGDFVQQSPNDGRPATERTEARVLFDGDAIYVGMRMYDAHPDSILAQLTRRDQAST